MPNFGSYYGARLDLRDLHVRTCKMNNVNHEKHEALKHWFQDLTKQAHIQIAPTPAISEASKRNPTKQLAGDLMLNDVSLRQTGKIGKFGVIDFSIVTHSSRIVLHSGSKNTTPSCCQKQRTDKKN